MKKKQEQPPRLLGETAVYKDDPFELGDVGVADLKEVSPNFLPRPEDLVFRSEGKKVTITLSKQSVTYFKKKAREFNTSYQRMIRNLVDEYVHHMRQ